MSSLSPNSSPGSPYGSLSPDRNPSPPPEAQQFAELVSAESIGNTAFSKHWLFSTLMKLIEEVDRENEEGDLVVDVDDELQNELCKLWDMSMNQEVATFLNEFKAIEILSGIIEKSKAPRVTEICVGILGNMACETTVCKTMSENGKFIKLVLDMLESRDTPTLVENTRLLSTCLSNSTSRGTWVQSIQRSEEVLSQLMFIFSSSTNTDLLKNTAELVATLLDLENDLCVSWATTDFIESLLEATNQIGSSNTEAMEVYLHIFQNFSTTESGVEVLVHHDSQLEKKILKYLNLVCEYEIVSVDRLEVPLASAMSVLHILLTARSPAQLSHLCKDERLVRVLLKILEPLFPMLQRYQEERGRSVGPVRNADKQDTSKQSTENWCGMDTENIEQSGVGDVGGVSGKGGGVSSKGGGVSGEGVGAEGVSSAGDMSLCDGIDSPTLPDGKLSIEDETDYNKLMTLYEILSAFIKDYCSLLLKVLDGSVGEGKTQSAVTEVDSAVESGGDGDGITGDSEADKPKTCSEDEIEKSNKTESNTEAGSTVNSESVLEYLDSSCSRSRLNNLLQSLRETTDGIVMFDCLYDHSKRLGKGRLCRIMNDVLAGRIVVRANSSKDNVSTLS